MVNSLIDIFHNCKSIAKFKQAHALLIVTGSICPPSALRPVVSFSALDPMGDLDYALLLVLCTDVSQTLFAFNTLIRGFALWSRPDSVTNAIYIFTQIPKFGLSPNNFTFTFLYQCLSRCAALSVGCQVHPLIVKNSILSDTCVGNSLIQFYSVCGEIWDAQRFFIESNNRDIVSWNSLMGGYVKNRMILEALELFNEMPEANVISWNGMITGLVGCGYLNEAAQLFQDMQNKNLVSWSIMISGYSQNGCPEEALECFREMVKIGMKASAAILVSVLSAVSQLAALTIGKWVHCFLLKENIVMDSILCAAIIDMYAKCGSLKLAMQVFNSLLRKDISIYTATISGLAMNGEGQNAIRLFKQMMSLGIRPDSVTYIAVLCACSHIRSVEEGIYYFRCMINVDRIEPHLDHYACMVDLLGRAGLLVEAEEFINSMPIEPDGAVWGALLASCKLHHNFQMAEKVGRFLLELDLHGDGHCVLLANLYGEYGKGVEAEDIRRTMKRRKIQRSPGFSLIEVDGTVHEFTSGDRSHETSDIIYLAWNDIQREINKFGYSVGSSGVAFDVEEEEKESIVGYHSEKLALACGIIFTNPGSTLRIIKNIRICLDCHFAFKLVSLAFARKIVVRDRKRFHQFESGSCSCMDFW